jgi:hypothetical protein
VPIGALLTWGIGYAYWMRDRQEDPGIDFNFMLPMWVGCGWVGTLTYALVVYGIVQAIRGSAERNQREPTVVEPGNQPPPYMPAAPNQGDEPTNHPH